MDKKKIFNWSITVALAGFLFGFDTVVISGANLPIRELWSTTPLFHGVFIMSMALWGTVLGSLFGSIPCDRIGRKNTLIWIGILFLVSALGSAIAWDPYSFSFFRFIGGIGVGASTVASPTYISEISNKERLTYSLPPKPPKGAFDIRFKDGWRLVKDHGIVEVMPTGETLNIIFDIPYILSSIILK